MALTSTRFAAKCSRRMSATTTLSSSPKPRSAAPRARECYARGGDVVLTEAWPGPRAHGRPSVQREEYEVAFQLWKDQYYLTKMRIQPADKMGTLQPDPLAPGGYVGKPLTPDGPDRECAGGCRACSPPARRSRLHRRTAMGPALLLRRCRVLVLVLSVSLRSDDFRLGRSGPS